MQIPFPPASSERVESRLYEALCWSEIDGTNLLSKVNLFSHRKEHLPTYPHDRGWATDDSDDCDSLSRLTAAAVDLPGIRADVEHLPTYLDTMEAMQLATILVRQSFSLETALLAVQESILAGGALMCNNSAKYETSQWRWKINHEYLNLETASTLNTHRTYMIYVHQARLQCLDRLASNSAKTDINLQGWKDEQEKSTFVLRQMCNEICASVAYHMDTTNNVFGTGESFISSALISASSVEVLPLEQTRYIESVLEYLAFGARESSRSSLVWDARIMTRMGRFNKAPSALEQKARRDQHNPDCQ